MMRSCNRSYSMCMFNNDGTWNPDGKCDGCGYCDSFDDKDYVDEDYGPVDWESAFEWDFGCQS